MTIIRGIQSNRSINRPAWVVGGLGGFQGSSGNRGTNRSVQTRANGQGNYRFDIFRVNQLGGIGRKNSQFLPNADGFQWNMRLAGDRFINILKILYIIYKKIILPMSLLPEDEYGPDSDEVIIKVMQFIILSEVLKNIKRYAKARRPQSLKIIDIKAADEIIRENLIMLNAEIIEMMTGSDLKYYDVIMDAMDYNTNKQILDVINYIDRKVGVNRVRVSPTKMPVNKIHDWRKLVWVTELYVKRFVDKYPVLGSKILEKKSSPEDGIWWTVDDIVLIGKLGDSIRDDIEDEGRYKYLQFNDTCLIWDAQCHAYRGSAE